MKANKVEPIRLIEESGIGEVVDQYFCEFVCKKGEFGKCKYFRQINNLPVCIRKAVRKENRLLK